MHFEVIGNPQGKARARTGYNPLVGKVTSYTPEKTKQYEDLIRTEFLKQCGIKHTYKSEDKPPISMRITAVYPMPKRMKKADRAMAIGNIIRPTVKPDADNVAKAVCDALNDLAYTDDTQIVELTVIKLYGTQPHVSVDITKIGKAVEQIRGA